MDLRAQQDARPWEERDGRGLLLDEDAGCFSCLPAFLRGHTAHDTPFSTRSELSEGWESSSPPMSQGQVLCFSSYGEDR